ncbi:MAG: TAXI family TRAP transporter solute-binding subunit [Arcobacteraceae bacterium]|nr:TAXI family TRAP transporter solute-binding subunit [Arcobacteraceae bacterium]
MNNIFIKIILPILSVFIIIFYLSSTFIEPPIKKEITIATGGKNGNYYKTALLYKELLEKENVKVNILQTAGSVENIELIKSKKADFAFVQSGIINSKDKNKIFSLVSLYYEPLWIFYKNEGFDIDYIIQLIGKKISIGSTGSGTQHLSNIILNINQLNNTNSTILNYSTNEGKEKLIKGDIDALFIVSSAKSDNVKELLANPDINFLNIKRSYAYDSKYSFLNSITLYEGTIDLYMNLPSENKQLLTTTANLVASTNVPDELVRLLLKQTKKVHSAKGIFEKEFQFPNLNHLDSMIHDEASRYIKYGDSWLENIFPFWIASNIDRLKLLLIPLLTLMIPLFKGIIPLYIFTIRSKIYKWYKQLNTIDIDMNNYSINELNDAVKNLEQLKIEVQKHTNVPMSYMGEYYNLILHIDLIHKKVSEYLELKKNK